MIFTEDKAKELKDKYNFDQSMINTWRFKGAIPDFYQHELSNKKRHIDYIKQIYEIDYIKISAFGYGTRLYSFFPRPDYIYKDAFDKIFAEMQRLKVLIATALNQPFKNIELLQEILESPCIFKHKMASTVALKYILKKNKRPPKTKYKQEILTNLNELLNKIP